MLWHEATCTLVRTHELQLQRGMWKKIRRAVLERLGYFIQATGIMCNADTVSIRTELLQYLNMGVD